MSTQALQRAASGQVASNGTIVLTFEGVPSGLIWSGTISVPTSDLGATWTASIGQTATASQPVGSWLGRAVFGPVRIDQGQRLILLGSNLSVGSQQQGVLLGRSDDVDSAPFLSPAPSLTSLTLDQLIITPGGDIQSSDFEVGVSGWRLSDPGGVGKIEAYGGSATIVAGVLATALAGRRVVIDNSFGGNGTVRFYTGDGAETLPGEIDGFSAAGIARLELASPDIGGGQAVLDVMGTASATRIVAQADVTEITGNASVDGDAVVNGVLRSPSGGAVPLRDISANSLITFDWNNTFSVLQLYIDGVYIKNL